MSLVSIIAYTKKSFFHSFDFSLTNDLILHVHFLYAGRVFEVCNQTHDSMLIT